MYHFGSSKIQFLVTICFLVSLLPSSKCEEIKLTSDNKIGYSPPQPVLKSELYGSAAVEEAFAKLNSIKVNSTLIKRPL